MRTSISAEISTSHGWAKEVQNFKVKVHSGPEGSRGLDYHRNEVFCHKFHLEYLSTSSPMLMYAKSFCEVTTMAVNSNKMRQRKFQFSKIEFAR